jgi:mannitol-1-phosphate 5-dehydrogenase
VVDGRDQQAVIDAVKATDLLSVSVGKRALSAVAPLLTTAISERLASCTRPLDLIIAENLREGASYLRSLLATHTPGGISQTRLGLVATCIGRMVPNPSEAARREHGELAVFAESATDFFADATAFRGERPDCPGLTLVDRMDAYTDRKLFVHNMTHSAVAYLAAAISDCGSIAESMTLPGVRNTAEAAGRQVISGLLAEYQDVFTKADLDSYLSGVLGRYCNKRLGDTVFRVGRDLARKLGPQERLIGAARLVASHGLPISALATVIAHALRFNATDPAGRAFPPDQQIRERLQVEPMAAVLQSICGLSPESPIDSQILVAVIGSE